MSIELASAIEAFRAVKNAERLLEKRRKELEGSVSRLNETEMHEYTSATEMMNQY